MKQSTVAPALRPYRKTHLIRGARKITVYTTGDPDISSYQQRINDLREELTQLNLYDHPLRIVEICKEIETLRSALRKV